MIRPGTWRREFAVPLQSIQSELNRLFDEYWQQPLVQGAPPVHPNPAGAPAEPTDLGTGSWTPAIDFWESASELTLVVDLPGVDPSTIDLSLAGNVLSLRGEKVASQPSREPNPSTPSQGASNRGRVRERPTGSFHRQVTLVEEVDFDRVEAQAKDGVLTVRLPKRGVGQPRTIPIVPAKS